MRNVVLRVALLSFALLLMGSGPASAHASLVGSDPADGATLAAAPSAITFTFNENIGNPAYIAVTAPNGSKVDVGDVRAIDNKVTATLPDVDQKGRYTASYRVVSADGHPVEGTIHYSSTTGRTVKQVERARGEDLHPSPPRPPVLGHPRRRCRDRPAAGPAEEAR